MHDSDDVIRTAPDAVRVERLLPGSIERVWAFLVDPDKRRLWLADGAFELRPGGSAPLHFRHRTLSPDSEVPQRFRDMHEIGHTNHGTVIACDPPHRLAWTWGHDADDRSEVDIVLRAEGDAVRLQLTHRRLSERDLPDVSGGWHTHLDILDARLSGRPVGDFWKAWTAHAARYAARFAAGDSTMLRIALTSVMVDDQTRARAFYVDTLGFELRRDIAFDGGRWLTVATPGAPGVELLLEPAGFEFAKTYQRALREAGIPINAFVVDDVQATCDRLQARGVVFQSAPVRVAGQTIAVFDDTCGNWIQIYEDDAGA